jgi:hypothetical protein
VFNWAISPQKHLIFFLVNLLLQQQSGEVADFDEDIPAKIKRR